MQPVAKRSNAMFLHQFYGLTIPTHKPCGQVMEMWLNRICRKKGRQTTKKETPWPNRPIKSPLGDLIPASASTPQDFTAPWQRSESQPGNSSVQEKVRSNKAAFFAGLDHLPLFYSNWVNIPSFILWSQMRKTLLNKQRFDVVTGTPVLSLPAICCFYSCTEYFPNLTILVLQAQIGSK